MAELTIVPAPLNASDSGIEGRSVLMLFKDAKVLFKTDLSERINRVCWFSYLGNSQVGKDAISLPLTSSHHIIFE